jgi:DNA-binding GntR family transcriptional regulator
VTLLPPPPTPEPAVRAASARIAAHLREAILGGELRPGDRIRQEEVAERFGASRLPVREALRILEAEGLTEHQTHKGARVPRLSQHEVEVIYQMRERLEPLAITESLPALTLDDLTRIEAVQRRIEANDDVDRFLELDREFHLLTYTACTIDPLMSMVRRLWNSTQHYRRAFIQLSGPGRMWVVNAEHRLILDALQRRDPLDAERHLSGHIRRTRIALAQHPEVFDLHPRGGAW